MEENIKIIFVVIFSIGFVSASSVSVWQGQYYTGTTFNTGTYVFNFTIYDSLIGGNVCYSNETNLTTGNWGQWKTEQVGVGNSCNNASQEYFLNINIDGADQSPRRRLTLWDFLRRDVEEAKEGNLVVNGNVSADYYFGNGSQLTGVCLFNGTNCPSSFVDTQKGTSGNYLYNDSTTIYFNDTFLNETIDSRAGDNSSWNETYANTKYLQSETDSLAYNGTLAYLADILGWSYYNSSDFDISNYLNFSTLVSFGYYNATNPQAEVDPYWSDNFTKYNGSWTSTYNATYDAYNSTGLIINWSGDYLTVETDSLAYNGSLYLTINPYSFYNSTTIPTYVETEVDPYWSDNFTKYNDSWSSDIDTQKNVSGNYLYNDSTTIYFNDTFLNETIDARSDGGTYLNLSGTNANQDVNISPYNFEAANLTLAQKITFALGEIVDNVVNGWIRINGGLNVTGDAVVNEGLNVTNDSYFFEDIYIAGKLRGFSPVQVEGGLNVSGNSIFYNNLNFTGMIYGNGSQLTDIEADVISDSSVTTSKIADNNITDSKIANLSWTKLVDTPTGLDDGDNDTTYSHLSNFTDDLEYYNSTDFDIDDYYLKTNPYSFYNSTSIPTYVEAEVDPYFSANLTAHNGSWTSTYNATYDAYNSTGLIINWSGDYLTETDVLNFNYWNDSYATFNKTYADVLYSAKTEPLSLHLNQDNWYNDSEGYIYWSENRIGFNQSKLSSTYYNASTIQAVRGTTAGTLANIQTYNEISYNVTEVSGEVGLDFRINFTGITSFNQIVFRYKNSLTENHLINLQIYNYDSASWENYGTVVRVPNYTIFTFGVFDINKHLLGGVVRIRVYQSENGNTGHKHQFDWVTISSGFATPSSAETDPFSIRRDGTTKLTGNWDQGIYNLTNTSSWFLGKVGWGTIQNKFSGSTTDNLAQGSINKYDNSSWNETYANTKYLQSESDPYWSDNFTKYNSSWTSTYNATYDAYNSTGLIINWSDSGFTESDPKAYNGSLYLSFNPYGFYNSTTIPTYVETESDPYWSDNFTKYNDSWTSTYNATYDAYNSTGLIINWSGDYLTEETDPKAYNGSLYLTINPYSFYNSTTIPSYIETEVDPLWSDNFTKYNSSWTSTYNATYDAYNSTGLIINWSGDYLTEETDPLAYNGSLYLTINPYGFYNSTTIPTYVETEVDPYFSANLTAHNDSWTSTYNATYDAYNSTGLIINWSGDYLTVETDSLAYNGSLYLTINPYSFYNSTTIPTYVETESDPYWSDNFTKYNDSWSSDIDTQKNVSGNYLYNDSTTIYFNDTFLNETIDARSDGGTYLNLSGTNANQDVNISPYNFEAANLTLAQKITFALGEIVDNVVNGWIRINGGLNVTGDAVVLGNISVEGIILEKDSTNHRIYDNSTCVIVRGDTSTMYIC